MVPKDVPSEAIQKEDGCDLCKAGVCNKAFICFGMPGARACLRCVQNKLKCSFNIPEGEDNDGEDGEDGPPTIGIVAEAGPMPTQPKCGRAQILETLSSKCIRRGKSPVSVSTSDKEAGPAPHSPLFLGSSGEMQSCRQHWTNSRSQDRKPPPPRPFLPSISPRWKWLHRLLLLVMEHLLRHLVLSSFLRRLSQTLPHSLAKSRRLRLSFFPLWSSQSRSFWFQPPILLLLPCLLRSFSSKILKLLLPRHLLHLLSPQLLSVPSLVLPIGSC